MSLEVMMGGRERFAKGMEFQGNFMMWKKIMNLKEFQGILKCQKFERILKYFLKQEIVAI